MLRVGMLTSGGDCQALNAAMRGVAKSLYEQCSEVEIYGFEDGYRGLVREQYHIMKPGEFSGILNKGGTILGTSRMPFKRIHEPDEDGRDKVACMIETYKKLSLDCLVVLGGNGSHKTADLLSKKGLNILTMPKTIDNDLYGTDVSFGFQSAVDIAANTIDCIHSTAASHSRVFIVELMGHKTGWLTLYAGMAGGADILLIPEIPYDIDAVVQAIQKRTDAGKRFSILAVAEGAISKEDALLTKKERKAKLKNNPYPSVSYKIGAEIEERTGQEIRITVPGHTQRGGSPCAYDRVIASRLGAAAAQLILEEKYGYMVGFKNREIIPIPLEEVAGKLKMVDPDSSIIREAKNLGISFGV
mgnify:FL=1